jgi:4-diphosphocytidyl-2-C-methyl-D-erythritol kinase
MQIRAAAKINLNLRVLGRDDATGFHSIETWMTPVDLADELHLELLDTPGVRLLCSDPDLDPGPANLAWRAADAFLAASGFRGGVRIELDKRIPSGAGLGGGSSDAAAVLFALNELTGQPLESAQLMALGATLGSDVPFFVRGTAAMASGRGEILEPHPLPHPIDLLLLRPPFPIATAWAYQQWSAGLRAPSPWVAPQLAGGFEIFNDLEHPAFAKHLLLPAMKQWLLAHSLVAAAGMSGSGSCLFAILRDPRGAADLAREARAAFGDRLWTAPCRTT